jgi:hypothetical protein
MESLNENAFAHCDHEPQLVGARTARPRVRPIGFARTGCPRSVRWFMESLYEIAFVHWNHESERRYGREASWNGPRGMPRAYSNGSAPVACTLASSRADR